MRGNTHLSRLSVSTILPSNLSLDTSVQSLSHDNDPHLVHVLLDLAEQRVDMCTLL